MAASNVEQPESKFNIDEYSDVVMLTKPVIYISIKEICDTHKLLLEHRNAIAPDTNDPLQELLDDVGDHPDVKELLGRFGHRQPRNVLLCFFYRRDVYIIII